MVVVVPLFLNLESTLDVEEKGEMGYGENTEFVDVTPSPVYTEE